MIMPRNYTRVVKGRPYTVPDNKVNKLMETAKQEVIAGRMTVRAAAQHYKIPKSTFHDFIKNKHCKSPGGQCTLTPEEEHLISNRLVTMSDWGFQSFRRVAFMFLFLV